MLAEMLARCEQEMGSLILFIAFRRGAGAA
jgi:hypothetical protein